MTGNMGKHLVCCAVCGKSKVTTSNRRVQYCAKCAAERKAMQLKQNDRGRRKKAATEKGGVQYAMVKVLEKYTRVAGIPVEDYEDFAGKMFKRDSLLLSIAEGSVPPGLVLVGSLEGRSVVMGRYGEDGHCWLTKIPEASE